jgi:hypothetical protein
MITYLHPSFAGGTKDCRRRNWRDAAVLPTFGRVSHEPLQRGGACLSLTLEPRG